MKDYICAIDIGSSLCRALVARPEPDGAVEILGVGIAPSRGVKSGVIINIEAATQCLSEAVREAELMSGLPLEEALVNITGRHLRGENSRGVVAITNQERVVQESDVLRVIEGAQNIRIPADQEVIHVLSREFSVDDQTGIRDPIGMTGVRLEADVHIVTAGVTALSNLNKAVAGAGISIRDGVMSSLASAEATLSSGEKDLGVAVVDIGGGVVDIIVYLEGGVFFSSVIPLGGIHVTQDLSIGLKIPVDRAEMVKKNYASARIDSVDPTEKVELQGMHGRPSRWVLRQQIAEIVEPRMKEIFELVDRELVRSGRKGYLAGGVVLTGGGSLIEGSASLAEDVFDLATTVGLPLATRGFSDRVNGPEFATSVGLLQYAARISGPSGAEKETAMPEAEGGVFQWIRHWIRENL